MSRLFIYVGTNKLISYSYVWHLLFIQSLQRLGKLVPKLRHAYFRYDYINFHVPRSLNHLEYSLTLFQLILVGFYLINGIVL